MAPVIGQEAHAVAAQTTESAAAAERWEIRLAQQAGSRLTRTIPHKTAKQLSDELLEQVLQEKRSRELQNLNHWPEYAPGYLDRVVRRVANREAWRRRKVAAFFTSDYTRARAYASRFLSSQEEIDDVVGEAFELVQAGRTDIENFYSKLRDLCVDRLRRMEVERGLFVSLEGLVQASQWADELLDRDLRAGHAAPTPRHWKQDPLHSLMDTRQRRAKPLMVGRAKKDPDWRFVRRNDWAQVLQKPCAKSTPSNG